MACLSFGKIPSLYRNGIPLLGVVSIQYFHPFPKQFIRAVPRVLTPQTDAVGLE